MSNNPLMSTTLVYNKRRAQYIYSMNDVAIHGQKKN